MQRGMMPRKGRVAEMLRIGGAVLYQQPFKSMTVQMRRKWIASHVEAEKKHLQSLPAVHESLIEGLIRNEYFEAKLFTIPTAIHLKP